MVRRDDLHPKAEYICADLSFRPNFPLQSRGGPYILGSSAVQRLFRRSLTCSGLSRKRLEFSDARSRLPVPLPRSRRPGTITHGSYHRGRFALRLLWLNQPRRDVGARHDGSHESASGYGSHPSSHSDNRLCHCRIRQSRSKQTVRWYRSALTLTLV